MQGARYDTCGWGWLLVGMGCGQWTMAMDGGEKRDEVGGKVGVGDESAVGEEGGKRKKECRLELSQVREIKNKK